MKNLLFILSLSSLILFSCSSDDDDDCECLKTTYIESNKVNVFPYIPYEIFSKELVPCQADSIKRIDDVSYYTILCE